MLFKRLIGAAYDAPKDGVSTEAMKHSSAKRAIGETSVSAMPMQYAPFACAWRKPSTVWRRPRRKLIAITRSLSPAELHKCAASPDEVAGIAGSPIRIK